METDESKGAADQPGNIDVLVRVERRESSDAKGVAREIRLYRLANRMRDMPEVAPARVSTPFEGYSHRLPKSKLRTL